MPWSMPWLALQKSTPFVPPEAANYFLGCLYLSCDIFIVNIILRIGQQLNVQILDR